MIGQQQAGKLWTEQNEQGLGFPVEQSDLDGWVQLLSAYSTSDVDVYQRPDGTLVAVGEANGLWAQEIGEY
jgi:hypothetical protein